MQSNLIRTGGSFCYFLFPRVFFLLLACCLTGAVFAQKPNYKKSRKEAEAALEEGDYYQAAEKYREAWEAKPGKEELIYQAAENYVLVRDYRAAAEAYQFLQAEADDYPLIALKYARALKQDGQYDKARETFTRFIEAYSGTDRPIMRDIVANELQGIDLAKSMAGRNANGITLKRPAKEVNSENNEYAPVPLSADQVYFGSTQGGEARLYESTNQAGTWGKAVTPNGFPVIEDGFYGGGSISADGARFYFSICNEQDGWENMNQNCEIYLTRRTASGWSQPEKLPDFINAAKTNNTHPSSIVLGGQEYLYFSSNRPNGRGGMDLWYAVRDLGVDALDFSFPVNLGPVINTLGDEITPFYQPEENALFFSSNGHPSLGGQDIFSSVGEDINWTAPANLGLPLNSSAEDYGYAIDRMGFGTGFLVSNRPFGGVKNNTRETDLFSFSTGAGRIILSAAVYDNQAGSLLNNVNVAILQIFDDGGETPLVNRIFPDGKYRFDLLPNRRYRVEIAREGYQSANYTVSTNVAGEVSYGRPLFLEPLAAGAGATPTTAYTPPPTPPAVTPTPRPIDPATGQEYTQRAMADKDNLRYRSVAPRFEGTYYKVQAMAVRDFNPNDGQYVKLTNVGTLESEALPERNLIRVLVGTFFNDADAKQALDNVQRSGFPSAYLVRYDDGTRYGRVNLD